MMSDNGGPSPRNISTAEATSPMSLTNSKPKRQLVSANTTSMPRPLHLALGSVVGSSSSSSTPGSISPSPSPSISWTEQLPASSASNDDSMGLVGASSANSPGTSRAPSPSPLSPSITGLKRHSASKRSSISYIPSSGHSPSQAQFGVRTPLDGFTRSPLSSTHPPTSFLGDIGKNSGTGLSRSSSLGSRGPKTPRGSAFNERPTPASTSQGSTEANGTGLVLGHLKERPPVTLAEKHAELLHFIAQKESKCLELRSQLAVHEAELLQLKRKWERIVNRGFERSMSPGTTNSSSPVPLSASLLSTSPTSPTAFTNNHLGPSSLTAPGAVVFEGIKGGVQGMSRLIAAGIESIVLVNGSTTPATPSAHEIDAFMSNGSIPLRTEATPTAKHWNNRTARAHGHGQKESQSSSSTTTSAASSATFSSLSSASTTTSATSASTSASVSGSSTSGNTTRKSVSASSASVVSESSDADAESEFGDFEEGRASKSGGTSMEQDQEQVLMVYDTGATPTMSPNPHFQRRRKVNEQVQVERLVLSPSPHASASLSANSAETEQEGFDWDDGWDEPASEAQAKDNHDSASPSDMGVHLKSASSLPLAPTIPGLGALNMGAPTTQQMSAWVGSVGKKWGELKGSTTFTKSQKRASVMLSDMQNTIVSALISPPPTNSPVSSSNPSTTSLAASSFSSNASHSARSPKTGSSAKTQSRSGTSLLDDSDDENGGRASDLRASTGSKMMAPVMVPDSLSPTSTQSQATLRKTKVTSPPVPKVMDDDEWNW